MGDNTGTLPQAPHQPPNHREPQETSRDVMSCCPWRDGRGCPAALRLLCIHHMSVPLNCGERVILPLRQSRRPAPSGLGTRGVGTERSPSRCRTGVAGWGEKRVRLIQVEANCVSLRFYLCNWQHCPPGGLVGICLVPAKKADFLEKAHFASKLKFQSVFLHSQSIFMRLRIFLGALWCVGSPQPAPRHHGRSRDQLKESAELFLIIFPFS